MHKHLHMILRPETIEEYPKIISHIKKEFTKLLPNDLRSKLLQEVSIRKLKKRESGMWHRRFYEHTIRTETETETELNHLTDYIHNNPVKHGLVEKAFDWEFSSFRRFVSLGYYDENWCDFTQLKDYQ